MAQYYCEKCGKTMDDSNFYTYKDGRKTEMCKKCLTMHIDNFDPQTFLWLLEKMDVPYVEDEWNVLRNRAFEKDPYKMNGMSVFGKYLSKMKLKQWKMYSWADTERLKEEHEKRLATIQRTTEMAENKDEELKTMYQNGQISEQEYRTMASVEAQKNDFMGPPPEVVGINNPYDENSFLTEDEVNVGGDLTQDDKLYLAMKWGRLYKPAEWVALEKSYNDYDRSFDLHNADLQRGTLQLCKLDLKSNQALDCGDIDGYSKLARASDALRKSLKFTEAQRKEDRLSDFSCYGQIVAFAEMNNDEDYIQPIDLSIDRDIVDADLKDIKHWTQTLVQDDPTIYKLVEQYIKKREALAEMEQDQLEAGEDGYQITDEDLADFRHHNEAEHELDDAIVEGEE